MPETSNEPPQITTSRSIGDQMVRTASLFQAILAFPACVILSLWCFAEIVGPLPYLYDFIRNAFNSLMAAGIIFLVIVQLKVNLDYLQILKVEIGKSLLATLIWIWLVLDSAFGRYSQWYPQDRFNRMVRAFICGLILLILFFPTLGYAIKVWMVERKKEPATIRDITRDESTPLLDAFD